MHISTSLSNYGGQRNEPIGTVSGRRSGSRFFLMEASVAIVATISGIALILLVLWEGFETIILPRRLYEPYVYALSTYFQVSLPPWVAEENWVDNWQGSYWERPVKGKKPAVKYRADHF